MILYDLRFTENLAQDKQEAFRAAYLQSQGYALKSWVTLSLKDQLIIGCKYDFVASAHKLKAKFNIIGITLPKGSIIQKQILQVITKNNLVPKGHIKQDLEITISI